MDKNSADIKPLPTMLSTIAKDTLPETLCEETLAELKRQQQTKTYTTSVDVFWSPDIALAEMKEKLQLFSSVTIMDRRKRPQSHINKDTNLSYTEKEIKEHRDACEERLANLRKIIKNKETPEIDKRNAQYNSSEENEKLSHLQSLPSKLSSWKPLRQIVAWIDLNHHKRDKYEEIALKYEDNVFVQQIWSCIRQRCSLMDEANKGRKNPMRNIHIALTFTPSQTYFVASWDIHRYEEHSILSYHTNCTEYNLTDDGQVVQFKSEVTMNVEQKQREENERKEQAKRKEEEEKEKKKQQELTSLTHHKDKWGHSYSQKGTKKNTAVYDDIWSLEPVSTEMRKEWEDKVAVITMDTKTHRAKFIGKRVVDASTHSLFSCIGLNYNRLIINRETEEIRWVDEMLYFPEPFTFQINKGRTGKYKENDTKQLRIAEKMDLKDFPKA